MGKRIEFTEDELMFLEEAYASDKYSISQIAKKMNCSRSTIHRVANDMGWEKVVTINNRAGHKIYWTKEMDKTISEGYGCPYTSVPEIAEQLDIGIDSVTKRARVLKLVKVKKGKLTKEQVTIITTLAQDPEMTIQGIADELDVNVETVRKAITTLNIKYERKTTSNLQTNEAFIKDLSNPRMSAPDLAEKHNVTEATVWYWRRKIYGKMKLQLHTTERMTTIEKQVANMLDKLDIVYNHQKKIDKWTVDFYLGNRHIIEVDGTYWHSKTRNIRKDKRKVKSLKSLGYKLLVITDEDLKKPKQVERKLVKFWVSPCRNTSDKNVVND